MTDGNFLGLFDGGSVNSVSSCDAFLPSSVSGGDIPAYYEINFYALPSPAPDLAPEAEISYTLWDKPLEQYTVSEGLLLFLAVVALAAFVWSAVKGGFKWQI